MARQFREQLEEEVQLEQARKAQRASAAPAEPVPAAAAAGAAAADPPTEDAGSAATPRAANGGGNELSPEHAHHEPPGNPVQPTDPVQTAGSPGADPTAGRPAQAGGADERTT
jgi:hypothetical protein